MQLAERLLEVMAADLVLLHVEGVEDGLIEHAPLLVVAAQVQLLRVLQQLQAYLDQARGLAQVLVGAAEAFADAGTSLFDLAQPGLDLPLRQGAVGRQVEEVLLLVVQRLQLGGELLLEQGRRPLLLAHGLVQVRAHLVNEPSSEADGRVVPLNRLLQPVDVDVRGVAGAVLPAPAEEVQVESSSTALGLLHDHALGDARALAVAAEQRPFEVVVVHTALLLGRRPGLDDVLHPLEQVERDQGLVSTRVFLAPVGDDADVVPVPEQLGELLDAHLLGRSAARSVAQPSVVEFVGQVGQGVVTRGVQLEGQLDQWPTLGVDDDRAELAPLGRVLHVEIA